MNVLGVKVEKSWSAEEGRSYCLLEVVLGEGTTETDFKIKDKKFVSFECCMDQRDFAKKLVSLANRL